MGKAKKARAARASGKAPTDLLDSPVTARLTEDERDEVRAYADRMSAANKIPVGISTAAGALIREGLAAIKAAEVAS